MTSTSDRSSTSGDAAVADVLRHEWGRLLALLVVRTRRLDLAEDALAEAFARAAERWPRDGVPSNPAAWLYTAAHRLIIGRVRAEATAGRKAPLLAVAPGWVEPQHAEPELADDRLVLIVLCCHPALPPVSQAVLALRLVIGTPVDQIARMFLAQEATMAARLTRAKRKIVQAGIPLRAPVDAELRERLDGVCRTVYLAFTAGYSPGSGADLLRADVAGDAVRLAGIVRSLVPDAPQARALAALLVLQHARRDARVRDGRLVTLADQDRATWRHDEIAVGLALLDGFGPTVGYGEELRLQARIAAEHDRSTSAAATDWRAIADLYAALDAHTGSPIVRMNRAVAVGEADGPRAGLALLASVETQLAGHHRLAAVRASLADRAGERDVAIASYRDAIAGCANEVERAHLIEQLAAAEARPPTAYG